MTAIQADISTLIALNSAPSRSTVKAKAIDVPANFAGHMTADDVARHIDRMNSTSAPETYGRTPLLLGLWMRLCGTPKLPD